MCKMPIVVFVNRQCNQTKPEASHAHTLESDEPLAIDSIYFSVVHSLDRQEKRMPLRLS